MFKEFQTRRDGIVLAVLEIISENCSQNLSAERIAAKRKISESILNKHFSYEYFLFNYFGILKKVLIVVTEYFSAFINPRNWLMPTFALYRP